MEIKIKRIYEKPEPDDGVRILVDRLWPRGLSKEAAKVDYWARALSPSLAGPSPGKTTPSPEGDPLHGGLRGSAGSFPVKKVELFQKPIDNRGEKISRRSERKNL